jgi:hypothetical protein
LNGRDGLLKGIACAAVGAVVVIVSVAGVPGVIEVGLTEHCGAWAGEGCTEQVRETELLNPFTPSAFTVAVELCPGLIGLGAGSDAERENSGAKLNVAVMV